MLKVAAGILLDAENRVLIAERPAGKSYAGYWEFPGGKIEAGESAETALVREFAEELGIYTAGENWQLFYHGRRGEEVEISFLLAQTRAAYQPEGLEKQRWRWAPVRELSSYQFPEPNTEVLRLLAADTRFA